MNLHERGRKLSSAVTGTIGLIAVIAASAIGLHTWADVQAAKAASQNSASTTLGTSDDEGSDDDGSGAWGGDSSSSSSSSSSANNAPVPLVRPGNGGPSHASTNGS